MTTNVFGAYEMRQTNKFIKYVAEKDEGVLFADVEQDFHGVLANHKDHKPFFQALMCACVVTGKVSVVDFLLGKGVDRKIEDDAGNNLVHLALLSFDRLATKEMITVLHSHDVDINVVNRAGQTPLNFAKSRGYMDVARELHLCGGVDEVARARHRNLGFADTSYPGGRVAGDKRSHAYMAALQEESEGLKEWYNAGGLSDVESGDEDMGVSDDGEYSGQSEEDFLLPTPPPTPPPILGQAGECFTPPNSLRSLSRQRVVSPESIRLSRSRELVK